MPQKLKSLLFLSCFIITAVLYYNIETNNTKTVDAKESNATHLDKITTSSFEDEDIEKSEEENGQEYSD